MDKAMPSLKTQMFIAQACLLSFTICMVLSEAGTYRRDHTSMTKFQMISLAQKIQAYQDDHGRLPEKLDQLLSKHSSESYATRKNLVDPWNNTLIFRVRSPNSFALISLGADQMLGGTGNNQDTQLLYQQREWQVGGVQ